MAPKRTITLAADRRGRVPFAVVGALLLVTSASVVYTVQRQSDSDRVINPAEIFSQAQAALHTEVQEAAQESLANAGEKPVTQTSNTPAGRAIAAGSAGPFERYTKLRFYLNLQEKVHEIERTHSQQLANNLTVRIGLPEVIQTTDNISQAIDRVSIQRADNGPQTPVENITISAGTVPITVYRHGEPIATKMVTVRTQTESAVFDMHEKTEEFDRNLENVEKMLYGPLYGITYTKGGIERKYGSILGERFFSRMNTLLEENEYTNLLMRQVQYNTFGTVAHNSDEAAASGSCLATYYTARFSGQITGEHIPPTEITCTMIKREIASEGMFPHGKTLSGTIQNMSTGQLGRTNPMAGFLPGNSLPERLRKMFENRTSKEIGTVADLDATATFERSEIAKIAFQNVTGQSFSMPGDLSTERVKAAYRKLKKADNNSINGSQPWSDGAFGGQIGTAIEDIYTVGSSVTNVSRTGDRLTPGADRRVVDAGTVQVVQVTDSDRNGIEKTVRIALPVTIEEAINSSTTTKSVTFHATIAVGTTASKRATVDERGIELPYTSPDDDRLRIDRKLPSFAGARGTAVGAVSAGASSPGEIERVVTSELNTSGLTTQGRFRAAVSDVVTSHGIVNHTELTTNGQRERLRDWLKTELRETHQQVLSENVKVTLTRREQLTKDRIFAALLVPEHKLREWTYEDVNGKYHTPVDKTRAALRKRYLETINWYINKAREKRNKTLQRMTTVPAPNGSQTRINMSNHIDKVKQARNFSVQNFQVPASTGPQRYRLNTAPDWPTELPKSKLQGLKPRDEIREDPEQATHTSLAIWKTTPLPNPGFPVVSPHPWFWYTSVNSWTLRLKAEYATFAVKPYDTEKEVANTSYVRQPQPVALKINGLYRNVGRVEPIGFETTNHIVGIMPGLRPMPYGSLGIGDRIVDDNFAIECTQSWPHVGVGHRTAGFGVRHPSCPSLGPWGDAIYHSAGIIGYRKLRSKWERSIRRKLAKWGGNHRKFNKLTARSGYGGPEIDKLFDWNKPLKPWQEKLRKAIREIREPKRDLSAGRLADVSFAIAKGMRAYNKKLTCPMEGNEDGRKGCDDTQLEVETFQTNGSQGNSIILLEGERSSDSTDRVLVVDTRPESVARNGIPERVKNAFSADRKQRGHSSRNASSSKTPVHYHVRKRGGEYMVELQNGSLVGMDHLEGPTTMAQTLIDVIEPEQAPGTGSGYSAPIVAVSYKRKQFLVAPDGQVGNWSHVKTQVDGFNTKFDVFVGSTVSYNRLGDDITPRSTVVLHQQQGPAISCSSTDHTPEEIYLADGGDSYRYRVSEEWRLHGPSTEPDTNCLP